MSNLLGEVFKNERGFDMEIKLVESPLWKRNAVIWFILSALFFYRAGADNSTFF